MSSSKAISDLTDHAAESTTTLYALKQEMERHSKVNSIEHETIQKAVSEGLATQNSLIHDTHFLIKESTVSVLAHTNHQTQSASQAAASVDTINHAIQSVSSAVESLQSSSVSRNQAATMTSMLVQILQAVGSPSNPCKSRASGVIGELNDDETLLADASSRPNGSYHAAYATEKDLTESIARLGRLVNEKERVLDRFDADETGFEAIIDDLDRILSTAIEYNFANTETAQAGQGDISSARKHLTRLRKGFTVNTFTINSTGLCFSTLSLDVAANLF